MIHLYSVVAAAIEVYRRLDVEGKMVAVILPSLAEDYHTAKSFKNLGGN